MDNHDFLLKSILYSWSKFVIIAFQYESKTGNYWKIKMYREHKLFYSEIEKSDSDISVDDLKKKLMNILEKKCFS